MKSRQIIVYAISTLIAVFVISFVWEQWVEHFLAVALGFAEIHAAPSPFRVWESVAEMVTVAAGAIAGSTWIVFKLVAREKRAEKARSESETYLANIMATAVDGIITIDERGVIQTVNPAVVKIFGYAASEIFGRNVTCLMPGGYRKDHDHHLAEHLRTGKAHIIGTGREVAGRHKNGAIFPIDLAVSETRIGGHTYFTGFVRDITDRKNAEHALVEALKNYQDVVDNAQAGMVRTRISDGTAIRANDKIAEMFGYDDRDHFLAEFRARDRYADPAQRDQLLANLKADGGVDNFEVQLVRRDGSKMWNRLSARVYPERDYLEIVAVEITKEKETEEQLRQSEKSLRAFLNATSDAAVLLDKDGTITDLNEVMARRLGHDRAELVDRNMFVMLPPEDAARRKKWLTEMVRSGQPAYTSEETGGAWLESSVFPVFDDDRNVTHAAVFTRDVTEQRQAAEELKRSEERFALALTGTNDVLWDWDIDAKKVYYSERVRDFFGFDPADLSDTEVWRDRMLPEYWGGFVKALTDHFKGDTEIFEATYQIIDAWSHQRWVRQRGVAIRDDQGHAYRMAGSISDISDYMENLDALRAAKDEAELANRTKTEFLANMTHELRTPLNAVIGFSEVMERETFGALGHPNYRQYARDILNAGRHLNGLINDVLDVSRIEIGELPLNEEDLSVTDLVRSCCRLIDERTKEAEVSFSVEMDEHLPVLYGDERRIKQVLLNLLANAVKFTEPGGSVRLNAGAGINGCFLFTVADTGVGIAAKDIAVVLSKFGQADTSLSREHEGAGLGLPLAKSLIELHGGSLDLSSEPGVGTTVTVRIPPERITFTS